MRTERSREDCAWYNERSEWTINTVDVLSKALNIEVNALIAVVKAVNRYTKHNGAWDRSASLAEMSYQSKEHFFKLITKDIDKLNN